MEETMITVFLMYAAVGVIAGMLAGLLGVGGGLVIVPMMVYCLSLQGVSHELVMHLSLGTSLASIMFTSISSFMAHHRYGAVKWGIVRNIVPGIFVGTFLGSCVAAKLSTTVLSCLFVAFLFCVAFQMILDRKPNASRHIPGWLGMFGVGNVIGAVSSFVGIGGGSLSVPFMLWCNIPAHHAIGTSAAIGFPIAVAGTVGYVYSGFHSPSLPEYALGFVYLPGLAGIVAASMLTAPLGVWLAHRLPVKRLKQVFALLLTVMGIRMLMGIW
jgi:uncharacterized protein